MKNLNHKSTVVFGIGNSARQDDGLGWAFLDEIQKKDIFKGELHYCYQLNIEDAEIISNAQKVIFVDAFAGEQNESCLFEKCLSNGEITYTTHALEPQAVLALSENVYGKKPDAYVLKIKGYKWEFEEGLSKSAKENLKYAVNLISEIL
ncbi:MAG: hydrogenase maturation protease [Bacteroidales bacterium]|nr:hydrogenase maturation protease [Bacteroidales bacterium]